MVEEMIEKSLAEAVEKHREGVVIMIELPAEHYLEANSVIVKSLTSTGYDGTYISFQRPFKNLSSLLTQQGIDINKLLFIDAASAFAEEIQEKNPRCIHISPAVDIDELVRAIYTSLPELKSEKRFIFIDSLTTIALYKPLSETMRFCEFLIKTVRKRGVQKIILIFNVAKDLAQKKFIRDIALRVDQVISVVK
ncbi:MAG: hypothetical protein AVW06_01235 [Hadesarchaea archaeon DG-33-1]|nr:MAG: hypothetical protein AVW06_01235 [Hadesarchaea archaeon DG-33-1]